MFDLSMFLTNLLDDGRITFQERPEWPLRWCRAETGALRKRFESYRLEIAGPLIACDDPTATAAVEAVTAAAWFLVSRREPESEVEAQVRMPGPPSSAAMHLSADLLLQFLPMIHRRVKAIAPEDRLTALVEELMRGWPLSGILSDVDDPPTTPLDFDGHSGLHLLYAERFAAKPKPAWRPSEAGLPYAELVFAEAGKDPRVLQTPPSRAIIVDSTEEDS